MLPFYLLVTIRKSAKVVGVVVAALSTFQCYQQYSLEAESLGEGCLVSYLRKKSKIEEHRQIAMAVSFQTIKV